MFCISTCEGRILRIYDLQNKSFFPGNFMVLKRGDQLRKQMLLSLSQKIQYGNAGRLGYRVNIELLE